MSKSDVNCAHPQSKTNKLLKKKNTISTQIQRVTNQLAFNGWLVTESNHVIAPTYQCQEGDLITTSNDINKPAKFVLTYRELWDESEHKCSVQ